MPNGPQTWKVLQGIQALIQSELLVVDSQHPTTAASPFTLFTAADQVTYGATNAIYIGAPKDPERSTYLRQCHIIPSVDESVYRRSFGGTIWDEDFVYVRFMYNRVQSYYQTMQDIIAARDVMWYLITHHAEMPGAATVQASKPVVNSRFPLGYYHDQILGDDWDCWGFLWWFKQVWTVPAIIP